MSGPYPLLLRPILMEKVWGGRSLERLGKALPAGKQIGESWELADLASTSASGGGGAAARSVIANGEMAGKTLHDALKAWGHDLLGHAAPTREGNYPLLVKFLDARENLSVQVHPSSSYAAAYTEAHLKTECWYILHAEPGSVIYKGLKRGVGREQFAKGIASGTVVEHLVAAPAVEGECHNLPSGTCHALGAGVLVAEVQTPSDTTFRVYDWGRSGRELHVEQALACIDFDHPAPEATRWLPEAARARAATLVQTEFFTVSEVVAEDVTHESCDVLVGLKGHGRIVGTRGDDFEPVQVAAGSTVVMPHALEGRWAVEPGSEGVRYLAVQLATKRA